MVRFFTALLLATGLASIAAAQSTYRIQPGDTLQIEVLEDSNLDRNVLVLPDGSISFPLIGSLRAGGRNVDTVAATISAGLEDNFAVRPTVTVSVAALAERRPPAEPDLIDIYILGEVNNPGRKEIQPGTTLLQFLAEAGGLSRFAAERRIQLRRVDPRTRQEKVYPFNYRTMGGSGSISGATVLAPGDVIFVPERRLFE